MRASQIPIVFNVGGVVAAAQVGEQIAAHTTSHVQGVGTATADEGDQGGGIDRPPHILAGAPAPAGRRR